MTDIYPNPLFDEKRSRDTTIATELVQGLSRLLINMDYRPIPEVTVHSGRRADIVGLNKKGQVIIVEVKSGHNDFATDSKWPDYLTHCDQFYFGVGVDFNLELLPDDVGIMVADKFGAEIVRPAAVDPMHASTRLSLLLRFARTAAARLNAMEGE